MAKENTNDKIIALGKKAAYNLADVNKTRPQYGALTPRWLTKVLEFILKIIVIHQENISYLLLEQRLPRAYALAYRFPIITQGTVLCVARDF